MKASLPFILLSLPYTEFRIPGRVGGWEWGSRKRSLAGLIHQGWKYRRVELKITSLRGGCQAQHLPSSLFSLIINKRMKVQPKVGPVDHPYFICSAPRRKLWPAALWMIDFLLAFLNGLVQFKTSGQQRCKIQWLSLHPDSNEHNVAPILLIQWVFNYFNWMKEKWKQILFSPHDGW